MIFTSFARSPFVDFWLLVKLLHQVISDRDARDGGVMSAWTVLGFCNIQIKDLRGVRLNILNTIFKLSLLKKSSWLFNLWLLDLTGNRGWLYLIFISSEAAKAAVTVTAWLSLNVFLITLHFTDQVAIVYLLTISEVAFGHTICIFLGPVIVLKLCNGIVLVLNILLLKRLISMIIKVFRLTVYLWWKCLTLKTSVACIGLLTYWTIIFFHKSILIRNTLVLLWFINAFWP